MTYFFVNQLPKDKRGFYADYNHKRVKTPGWEYVDIQQYVSIHRDNWLNDFERWHDQLNAIGLRCSPWWWLIPGSRLFASFYPNTPNILKPFLFAISLINLHEGKDEDIYLIHCPNEVAEYLKLLSEGDTKNKCSLTDKSGFSKLHGVRAFVVSLGGELITPVVLMKHVLVMIWQYLKHRNKNLKKLKNAEILIFSFLLNTEFIKSRYDHYFGSMFDDVPNLGGKIQLWVYLSGLNDKDSEKILQGKTSGTKNKYIVLQQYIQLSDVIKIGYTSLRILFSFRPFKKKMPPLKIGQHQSSLFPVVYYSKLIKNVMPIEELKVYYVIKRLLKVSSVQTLFYPYEEKGLERAMLKACKEHHSYVRTIGMAHAVLNSGCLYVRYRPEGIDSPKPEILMTTGPAARDWYVNWAKTPVEKLVISGSKRYTEPLPLKTKEKDRQHSLRVLFIGGLWHELGILADYVEEDEQLFKNCELLIRKYPFSWQGDQDAGIARLRTYIPNLKIGNESLTEQLEWCDVAIFCHTSAGIEAMLHGRFSIYLELHDIFKLDPLEGKGELSKLECCSSPSELKQSLARVQNMSKKELLNSISIQIDFARQIYSPVDKLKIAEICQLY